MCGIAGKVAREGDVRRASIEAMCARQRHRGPDSRGVHVGDGVGLGVQRLRVIDLETGDQPIYNEDRSICVVLNGEIYNYRELRARLMQRGHTFATHSDTEVLVHLYEDRGPELVKELVGMFAFALWDSSSRRLVLARDRVGKKPLHFFEREGGLTFASELEALRADPEMPSAIDASSLDEFLAFGYIPAPNTIWRAVRKLQPGHLLVWEDGRSRIERWWRLDYSRKLDGSPAELEAGLRARVAEAVRRRMIADVPLGAFLSGGIDSSIVVSEMASQSTQPVKTFSIGFSHERFNELPRARLVAERYGTDHTEFTVEADAVSLLPRIARHYGEPYGDSSAIPTFHLAELTRREVTVALNGDGGDESFAGYPRHLANALSGGLDHIPWRPRAAVAAAAARLRPGSRLGRAGYARRFLTTLGEDAPDRYASHVGIFSASERAAVLEPEVAAEVDAGRAAGVIRGPWESATGEDRLDRILQVDVETYLPGDLLTKVDIATMAHSLEARSPLLDHEVMEFAAALPDRLKRHRLQKKWFLRRAFRGILPAETLDAPKRGFGVPIGSWFRNELRGWVRETLCGRDAPAGGLVRRAEVDRIVRAHQDGASDQSAQIWALLCLQAWHTEFAAT
jgi:asparagine synthase (glutamine-hydrolysing)